MHMKLSLFLASALATTSLAARANAATVDIERSQGANVGTQFSGSAEITCADGSKGSVFAYGGFSGNESTQKSSGSPGTVNDGVFVEIDGYNNSCTDLTVSGFGGLANGFVPPNKNLTSARLVGTTTVQDFGGGQSVSVSFDLKIKGTGPLTASKENSVSHDSGAMTVTISHSGFSSRDGTVTGTLSVGGVKLDASSRARPCLPAARRR